METIITIRNKIIRVLYKGIAKQIFFRFDPENVHDRANHMGQFMGKYSITRVFGRLLFGYKNPCLQQKIAGITFENPVGLAAGFDKDAELTQILPSVGFGFEEVGSITGEPCSGNPKPRLWRLPASKSIVVYYGLKNEGAEAISLRLQHLTHDFPIGTSIAKTNNKETAELEAGIADYVKGFSYFTDIGDYYTINISCPNAFGGQPFHDPELLEKLLSKISKIETKKPVFLKISPDLTHEQIDGIISVARKYKITGFVCTNLTKNRENHKIKDKVPEKGGLSGKVVEDLSNELIRYIYTRTNGEFIIIGCGGIFTAEDAYRKIRLGASLVQMITGMIYEGPQVISEINQGLIKCMELDGFHKISEAVGSAYRN